MNGIQRFGSTQVYEAHAPVSAILSDIPAIRAFDRRWERWQKLAIALGLLALLGAGGSCASTAVLPQQFEEYSDLIVWLGVLGSAGLAVVGIALLVVAFGFLKRKNLDDRRYELVARLLPLLAADMAPASRVRLRLDLRPATDVSKRLHHQKYQFELYRDPWLQLSGHLLDGTTFSLGFTEDTKFKGAKRKLKTKLRAGLRVRVDPRRYPGLAGQVYAAAGLVSVPPPSQVSALQLDGTSIAIKTALPGWHALPRTYACDRIASMLFLSAYQVLHRARVA